MTGTRTDEVGQYYKPARRLDRAASFLFWMAACLSLLLVARVLSETEEHWIAIAFVAITVVRTCVAIISRAFIVPGAERLRTRQLLTDSLGIPLSHDRTNGYYNNPLSPSHLRLAASTMENALFTSEICARMLLLRRPLLGFYFLAWILLLAIRQTDLAIVLWITQLVFSAELLDNYIRLEVLRARSKQVFEQLNRVFVKPRMKEEPTDVAETLDALILYESAKASASIQLSERAFRKLNPELSAKWDRIRRDLPALRDVAEKLSEQGMASEIKNP